MALMDGSYNLPYPDISDGMCQHNWGEVIPQITQSHAKKVFIGSVRIFELKPEVYWQLMQLRAEI